MNIPDGISDAVLGEHGRRVVHLYLHTDKYVTVNLVGEVRDSFQNLGVTDVINETNVKDKISEVANSVMAAFRKRGIAF